MQSWENKLGFDSEPALNIPDSAEVRSTVQEIEAAPEFAYEPKQVEQAARESLDFLAAIAMPAIFKYFWPPGYKAIWAWLIEYIHKKRDFSQLALGLPRGFAKTTFIKLFVLYCILFTERKFILICAASQKKAEAIVSDVMDFLNESNIIKVFGDWKVGVEKDSAELKKFGFRGRNIILAAGTVATVRGLNVKHERPDVMLFDDIQSREDADSETVSKQIETDLYGTAMKAKSPHGCLFVFIANMYPTKWSLLRRMKENPGWLKFIVGGIRQNGTSFWEDLQPVAQLLNEYQNDLKSGRPEVFFAEVLNDENASVNNLIDLSALPEFPFSEKDFAVGGFIIIDPATGKSNGDAVTVAYCRVYEGPKPQFREVVDGSLSPLQNIEVALRMALKWGVKHIFIESNAYQATLGFWFNHVCLQYGISGITAHEIYSGVLSKNSRILGMFKELKSGELNMHPDVRAACSTQIIQFNPLKINNTDGILDCMTYCSRIIAEYPDLIQTDNIIDMQEIDSIPVRSVLETSCW